MTTLRGRIGLTLLVFGLVTLIAVGGALWVVLRELHRDAALGSLAQLTVPYSNQARNQIPAAVARALQEGRSEGREDGSTGRPFGPDREGLNEFVRTTQAEIEAAGISIGFLYDGQLTVLDPETRDVATFETALDIEAPRVRGDVRTTATFDCTISLFYLHSPGGSV